MGCQSPVAAERHRQRLARGYRAEARIGAVPQVATPGGVAFLWCLRHYSRCRGRRIQYRLDRARFAGGLWTNHPLSCRSPYRRPSACRAWTQQRALIPHWMLEL